MTERKTPTPHEILRNLVMTKGVLDVPSIELVGKPKEIERREEMLELFNQSVGKAQTLKYDVGKLLKDAERVLYPERGPEEV
ncbi:hypothetical protein HYT33_01950 [Candidatus Roizmanbacteria bacterium]|nr:hypothetical protein [Candidatus Roizmanbacteria bacterium]